MGIPCELSAKNLAYRMSLSSHYLHMARERALYLSAVVMYDQRAYIQVNDLKNKINSHL